VINPERTWSSRWIRSGGTGTGDDSCTVDDRGQAALELVAVLPMVLTVLAVCLQLLIAGYTVVATDDAARAAARACSASASPTAAARSALPSQLMSNLDGVATAGEQVTVRVRMPVILPAFPGYVFARSATYARCSETPGSAIGGAL